MMLDFFEADYSHLNSKDDLLKTMLGIVATTGMNKMVRMVPMVYDYTHSHP